MNNRVDGAHIALSIAAVLLVILGAVSAIRWENHLRGAKAEACASLGSTFENAGDDGVGGYCIKGNTITLRFKN